MNEMTPERMEGLEGGGLCSTLAGVAVSTFIVSPTASGLAWAGYGAFCTYYV